MNRLKLCALLSFLWLVALPTANSQTVTGSITGTVTDPAGAVIVGAPVTVVNDVNQQVRTDKTGGNGSFEFTSLLPGTYTLRIAQPGFKSYQQKNIILGTAEKVDVHNVMLEVGDVSTSIEVQAEASHVQTDTSDHSIDVNLKQIQDTPIRGRNYQAIVKDLAGVQDLNSYDTRGWGAGTPTINGGAQGQVLVTLDGIAAQDSGAPGLNTYQAPSADAVSEVRLLVSNYAAEFGSRNGGQENISIKSGSPQFHGSAYYYWRHEELNANEWNNDALGNAKAQYRYQNPGGTVGGPLIIPFVRFNKDRNRLFFFFSYDYLHNVQSTAVNHYTMPTLAERNGDFTHSYVGNNNKNTIIPVYDRSTGAQWMTENKTEYGTSTLCKGTTDSLCNYIPVNSGQIDPIGQAMLNEFPLPNTTDISGNNGYNFQFVGRQLQPRIDKILRVDYNISSKNTMFVRLLQDWQDQSGQGVGLGASGANWGQFPSSYHIPSAGIATTFVHTFTPNLVNEFVWGINKAHQENSPTDLTSYNADLLPFRVNGQSYTLPRIYPQSYNTLNLDPNINFGLPSGFSAQSTPVGTPAALPSFGFDSRWPFDGTDSLQNLTNNITWVKGPHTFKAGFYYEHDARNVSVYSVYSTEGTYYFGVDRTNPVDTGDPFSNALTGSTYGYGEDSLKMVNRARYKQFEWFVQDTWKVSRRLTVDYGVRFQWLGPLYSSGDTLGLFQTSAYNRAQAGQLLYPACTVTVAAGKQCPLANRVSVDRATGAQYPYVLQGTFDPATFKGLPYSGIVNTVTNLWNAPPIQYNPRLGFAWDLFGDGKTAMRGGVGIFHGRYAGVDTIGATMQSPPNFITPIVLSSTIANLAGASTVFTPTNINGGSRNILPPTTYDWSFGIQHNLGKGYILDVSYLGYVTHHGMTTSFDLNAVPPYTTWTPTGGANKAYLDPTSANGGTGAFLSTNLIRSLLGYQGFGSISTYQYNGENYYDALQVQFNKRVGGRLQYGVNYTWSKTITYGHSQFLPDQLLKNVNSNRPHAVNLNFSYAVPNGSGLWKNAVTQGVLDGWHIAGIGTFYYGTPLTIGCSATGAPIGYWTGTPTTAGIPFRCQQTGNLWLSTPPPQVGNAAEVYAFNQASFTLPPATSWGIGNTPPTLTYGPGVANIDLNVYKDFKLGGERRTLQIKAEAFNALNHFNPGNPNSSLTYSFSSCTNTNGSFSNCTNTNSNFGLVQLTTAPQVQARHMILSARFSF